MFKKIFILIAVAVLAMGQSCAGNVAAACNAWAELYGLYAPVAKYSTAISGNTKKQVDIANYQASQGCRDPASATAASVIADASRAQRAIKDAMEQDPNLKRLAYPAFSRLEKLVEGLRR